MHKAIVGGGAGQVCSGDRFVAFDTAPESRPKTAVVQDAIHVRARGREAVVAFRARVMKGAEDETLVSRVG